MQRRKGTVSFVTLALVPLAALLTAVAPIGTAGHIPVDEFRKGCPFSESEWEDGVYDCGGRIPSIQNSTFDDGSWLEDGDVVIGVAEGGQAKAYPIRILDWHEIANDRIAGEAIVVSYCPLCGSAIVYDRVVNGEELAFHVSGYLFRNDLVMVDAQTNSLWPQIEGEAARGPMHGTLLDIFPSQTVSWEIWKDKHPDTLVLSRPLCGDGSTDNQAGCRAEHQRDYTAYPYGNYQNDGSVGISGERRGEVQGLHPKDFVLGITVADKAKAYPFFTLDEQGVINDDVDGTPVVVAWVGGDGRAFLRPAGTEYAPGETIGTFVDDEGNV